MTDINLRARALQKDRTFYNLSYKTGAIETSQSEPAYRVATKVLDFLFGYFTRLRWFLTSQKLLYTHECCIQHFCVYTLISFLTANLCMERQFVYGTKTRHTWCVFIAHQRNSLFFEITSNFIYLLYLSTSITMQTRAFVLLGDN